MSARPSADYTSLRRVRVHADRKPQRLQRLTPPHQSLQEFLNIPDLQHSPGCPSIRRVRVHADRKPHRLQRFTVPHQSAQHFVIPRRIEGTVVLPRGCAQSSVQIHPRHYRQPRRRDSGKSCLFFDSTYRFGDATVCFLSR